MVDMIMLEHIKMICITVFIQQSFFKLYNFSLYYTFTCKLYSIQYSDFYCCQISIVVTAMNLRMCML